MATQFLYTPVVWMFHDQKLTHDINRTHERSLETVDKDHESSFGGILAIRKQF